MTQPSKGYTRCLYLSDGNQCETWFKANGKKFCVVHDEHGIEYTDINREREFCYQFFADIAHPTLDEVHRLDEHIASLEDAIKKQQHLFLTSRAVQRQALDNLSEDERKERLKYVPAKRTLPKDKQPKVTKPGFKKDTEAYFAGKGLKASDLLDLDEDALLAKFAAAKNKKEKDEKPTT